MGSEVLLLGNADDALTQTVAQRLAERSRNHTIINEDTLFGSQRFVFALERTTSNVIINVDGRGIRGEDMGFVLFRFFHQWWPSSEFSLSDRSFVYHETAAAWFAVLEMLPCPVVNRYPLRWWLNDECFVRKLVSELSAILLGNSRHEHVDATEAKTSVFLVGDRVIADEGNAALVQQIHAHRDQVAAWLRATGLQLVRIDAVAGPEPRPIHVELSPNFNGESRGVVDQVVSALLECFA